MNKLILCLVALGSLSLKAEVMDTCYSQCLGVSTYSNELRFLGHINSLGNGRLNSWRQLNQKCTMKAKRLGLDPILAEGTFVYEADHSWSSYSWYREEAQTTRSFRYSNAYAMGEGGSSFYQNDVMKLKVEFARPVSSCFQEDVDLDNVIEYYEGDLPVLGYPL